MNKPNVAGSLPMGEPATGVALNAFDVVALVERVPHLDVAEGTWGTVLTVAQDGRYEVEFTDRDGTPLHTAEVPGEVLELLWSEADL